MQTIKTENKGRIRQAFSAVKDVARDGMGVAKIVPVVISLAALGDLAGLKHASGLGGSSTYATEAGANAATASSSAAAGVTSAAVEAGAKAAIQGSVQTAVSSMPIHAGQMPVCVTYTNGYTGYGFAAVSACDPSGNATAAAYKVGEAIVELNKTIPTMLQDHFSLLGNGGALRAFNDLFGGMLNQLTDEARNTIANMATHMVQGVSMHVQGYAAAYVHEMVMLLR